MKKLTILIPLLFGLYSFGQKTFQLTINIDSTIDTKRLTFYCDNGSTTIRPLDSFFNNRSILTGKLYSKYVTVTMVYDKNDSTQYYHKYWITGVPASITLEDRGNNDIFENAKLKNSIDIYKENKRLKTALQNYTKIELNKMSALWDSVVSYQQRSIFDSLERKCIISLLNKSSRYIKKNNGQYFYFWYFIDQFYETARISHKKDTALIFTIRDSLLSIFPRKFTESFETKKILEEIENDIHPKINVIEPSFKATTIGGNLIDVEHYKGKYILLDFWASWCPPCMKQLPFIKELRNKYDSNPLEIVGISLDRDSLKMRSAIVENDLNWTHIWDRDEHLQNRFYIKSIPVTILINREGEIIYNSSVFDNREKLVELLDGVQKAFPRE